MTETEVERLVVRLVGDSTSYVKMLTDAQKKTKEAAEQVEKAASRIEKFQKHLEGFGQSVSRVFSVAGITVGFKALYDQFDKADDLITELSAMIKMNGGVVDEVLPKYQEFAAEMNKLTTSSKGATLELLKQAESLGLSGQKAKNAAKNAISLGSLKDVDPASFMRQAVNFEKTGNVSGIARQLGLIGEMEDGMDRIVEVQKTMANGWELAKVKGEDGGAKIVRSLNSIKEVGKEAGAVIASVFEPMIGYLEKAAENFKKSESWIRKTVIAIVLLAASIEPVIIAYGFLRARVLALVATMTVLKQAMIGNMVMQNTWANAVEMGTKRVGAAIVAYSAQIGVFALLTAAVMVHRREMEKLNEVIDKGKSLDAAGNDVRNKMYEGMSDEQIEKERLGKSAQLGDAKKRLDEFNKTSNPLEWIGKEVLGGADRAAMQAEIDALQQQYNKIKDVSEARKRAAEEAAKQPLTPPKVLEDIKSLNDALNLQIQTVGMSETEAKIYELRMKAVGDAAAQADLDVAEYNGRMLEAAKAQHAANDSAKDLIKSMEFQIKTWGMSEGEALRYKLTLEGVDAATIDQAVALQDQLDGLEAIEEAWNAVGEKVKETKEQYQSLNAVVAGGADAAQLIYQYSNQFGSDTGAVNKAATLRRADFSAQPDRNFLGPQLKGADAMKETEKKLDDLKTVLEQIRDKEQVTFEGADLTA